MMLEEVLKPCVCRHQKGGGQALGCQGFGKRDATHRMAEADTGATIDVQGDFHGETSEEGSREISKARWWVSKPTAANILSEARFSSRTIALTRRISV
ncbi:hypothetical protein D3C86_1717470 [compost metagenome]